MESPFNLIQQNTKIESRIIVALERISGAFRVLLWNESKETALSPIQIQILIFLLFHPQEICTVSYLAQEFSLTKPTISDSVKLLLQKGLIRKFDSQTDTRSYVIGLTDSGKETAEKSANFAFALERPLYAFSQEQKEALLNGLLKLIQELNRAGVITVQRMCFTCAHYSLEQGEHYCRLVQGKLVANDLKLDCPEHQLAQ